MSRPVGYPLHGVAGAPRASGDEPKVALAVLGAVACSPRERG